MKPGTPFQRPTLLGRHFEIIVKCVVVVEKSSSGANFVALRVVAPPMSSATAKAVLRLQTLNQDPPDQLLVDDKSWSVLL